MGEPSCEPFTVVWNKVSGLDSTDFTGEGGPEVGSVTPVGDEGGCFLSGVV